MVLGANCVNKKALNEVVIVSSQGVSVTHIIEQSNCHPGVSDVVILLCLCLSLPAPPRLVYSISSTRIQRVNLDGRNLFNIYSSVTAPRAMDIDFRCVEALYLHNNVFAHGTVTN